MSQTAQDLFGSAQDDGNIGAGAFAVLNVPDVGAQIQGALGISMDDVTASEVVLASMLVDDSGSISSAGNEQVVRDGVNIVLEALAKTKQADGILAMIQYLNGTTLAPYDFIAKTPRLDAQNYRATGGTPLYDKSVEMLAAVIAKTQESLDQGVPCRSVTLIVSDGDDVCSRRNTAKDVAQVVKDMLKAENHIVAALGIDDGSTNFRQVFTEMGIRDEWILTPANDTSEIRRAFQMFSQSAVRASQAANFSTTATGGFAG